MLHAATRAIEPRQAQLNAQIFTPPYQDFDRRGREFVTRGYTRDRVKAISCDLFSMDIISTRHCQTNKLGQSLVVGEFDTVPKISALTNTTNRPPKNRRTCKQTARTTSFNTTIKNKIRTCFWSFLPIMQGVTVASEAWHGPLIVLLYSSTTIFRA